MGVILNRWLIDLNFYIIKINFKFDNYFKFCSVSKYWKIDWVIRVVIIIKKIAIIKMLNNWNDKYFNMKTTNFEKTLLSKVSSLSSSKFLKIFLILNK